MSSAYSAQHHRVCYMFLCGVYGVSITQSPRSDADVLFAVTDCLHAYIAKGSYVDLKDSAQTSAAHDLKVDKFNLLAIISDMISSRWQ